MVAGHSCAQVARLVLLLMNTLTTAAQNVVKAQIALDFILRGFYQANGKMKKRQIIPAYAFGLSTQEILQR